MLNFTRCPFCAGHESISPEAAKSIELMIYRWLETNVVKDHLAGELENIRNAILNQQERTVEEKLPLCPTPQKRKYSNLAHATPDANKWRQHPYKCECTYWHLSKQSPIEHTTKINTPAATSDEFEPIDPLLR